jgi:hypothetical protein
MDHVRQDHRRRHRAIHAGALIALVLPAGCEAPHRPPPPLLAYEGLPVRGSLDDALKAGFTRCIAEASSMRCRRQGVRLAGQGPYSAAVDLVGGEGGGGFDLLTLWNDDDQYAVQVVGDELAKQGWSHCFTGSGTKGDQAIYTHDGAAVRIAIDLSYWGKRRLRIFPETHPDKPHC